MAVSPLVPRSPSVANSAASGAPLKLKGAGAPSSTQKQDTASPLPSTDRELTEQLNDDVRNKYVKGRYIDISCYILV